MLIVLLVTLPEGFAQSPPKAVSANPVATPTIDFELNWPETDPPWWSITVNSDGIASYSSRAKATDDDASEEPYTFNFTATEVTRKRMFELARALNFFQGDFEYRGGNIAKTGVKTLRYQSGTKTSQTTFNYSSNTDLMDLVSMFQKISTTIEYGQRIEFKLRFDKLGLDAELKGMERASSLGALLEVQAVAPILQRAINDRAVMNISKTRIQHILGQNGGSR